jgi:NifU-like N terminal domain
MTDTIKTGTVLIEEDALMPESLRFESEPWTPFYMAGEIIRELPKASGQQSKYGSEGNMAHSNIVIDHYDHPRDVGRLPKDDPNGGNGLLGAPDGDVMKLQMKINSETQVIEEAEFKTSFGCGSAIASSSLATEWVKGKTSRKRWPSRTRISSASSAFPRATLLDATRYSRIGGRLHLVSSPIF